MFLLNIRTSKMAFGPVLLTNPMAFVAIAAMIVLQLLFTYVPFMQGGFTTAGLGW